MSSVQDVRKSQKEWTAVKKNVGVGEDAEVDHVVIQLLVLTRSSSLHLDGPKDIGIQVWRNAYPSTPPFQDFYQCCTNDDYTVLYMSVLINMNV